jgi:crossover junction endodeoxyribonuclease RusA
MTDFSFTIPLPHKGLSPNARSHFRTLAALKKAARQLSSVLAGGNLRGKRPQWVLAETRIKWYTKTVRHPDPDNALASLKATWDGLKDAGLILDDNYLQHMPIVFAKDASNPRVEITVTQLTGQNGGAS